MEYIDLQINGAFGVDFNDDSLTAEEFEFACKRLSEIGVQGFLATVITESIETMCQRIRKLAEFIETMPKLRQQVWGIHVEGPFLSDLPGFYGTHPAKQLCLAEETSAMRLLDAGKGTVRLMTLAPERDPDGKVIQRLCREDVLVFAGHTDASLEMLKRSLDHGLIGFTHLGNGCVHQVARHDNIIQRVLALREQLHITLIADGIHLPAWLLQSWLNIFGTQRCIVISDAISAAGMPPGEYTIGTQKVVVESSRRTVHRDHGYLAGSASTMADMDQFLSQSLDLSEADRRQVLFANAAKLFS